MRRGIQWNRSFVERNVERGLCREECGEGTLWREMWLGNFVERNVEMAFCERNVVRVLRREEYG